MKISRRHACTAIGVASLSPSLTPNLFADDGSNDTKKRLTDADVDRLLQQVTPDPSRSWRSIPWKIALLDAQKAAVAGRKPIFIWAMDGHPLGCT